MAKLVASREVILSSSTAYFDGHHPQLDIPIIFTKGVIDIVLSLHGTPAYDPDNYPEAGRRIFKMQLCGGEKGKRFILDIGEVFWLELRNALERFGGKKASQLYAEAANRWLDVLDESDAVHEIRQRLNRDVSTTPLSALLDDRVSKYPAELFNFIYSSIQLSPVSLGAILHGFGHTVSSLSDVVLSISSRPSKDSAKEGTDRLSYEIKAIISDELAIRVDVLEESIGPLIKDIEASLATSADSLGAAADKALELSKRADSYERVFASAQAELRQVKAAVSNLSADVSRLK